MYFAVSLLPFSASRQPKFLSFYLLSCELLVFWLSRKVSFSEITYREILGLLSYNYQIVIIPCYI